MTGNGLQHRAHYRCKVHSEIKTELEIRSVERGICPIATSTLNELFL